MYSIVSTLESGNVNIVCVPESWVNTSKKQLLWPPPSTKKKRVQKMRASASSPEDDWLQMCCQIKETGIASYTDGLQREKYYASFTDTEAEQGYMQAKDTKRRHPGAANINDGSHNYNLEFGNKIMEADAPSHLNIVSDGTSSFIPTVAANMDPEFITYTYDENMFIPASELHSQLDPEVLQLIKGLEQQIKQLTTAFNSTCAEIHVKLDKMLAYQQGCGSSSVTESVECLSVINKNGNIEAFVFPLNTLDTIRSLDAALTNVKFRKSIIKMILSHVGTNDGDVDGHFLNKMAHQIFTDELLSLFTFKGISRKGIHKENFSEMKNVLSLFQNMLFQVSPIFDDKRTAKFIQTKLLRHTGSRIKRDAIKNILVESGEEQIISIEARESEVADVSPAPTI